MNTNIPLYQRHSKVSIDEVLLHIKENLEMARDPAPRDDLRSRFAKHRVNINGQMVGVSSTRLRTFYCHGTDCSCCGLEASFFAIERDLKSHPGTLYHLNLYGYDQDGNEVLFTHDHTLARGLGGSPKSLQNTTTMCCWCNWGKGAIESTLKQKLEKLGPNDPEVIELKNQLAKYGEGVKLRK